MKTLSVPLDGRTYPIHIGAGALQRSGELLAPYLGKRIVVVTNPVIGAHFLTALRLALAPTHASVDAVVLPEGESHKDWSTLQDLLTRLLELQADRATTLIALGGGVIGDITGFAAAIYQRGIPFIQVPTTLLAQVDSSVGGKTGINHPLGKNMIGAFYQPRAVLIDTECLRTLPQREMSAGLAEVVKYGAIRSVPFLEWLESNAKELLHREGSALTEAIFQSCSIKTDVVAADERESGERALLNFGHTFGHAIEVQQGYGTWLHGEAVGAGMVLAARVSQKTCGLTIAEVDRLVALLRRLQVPVDAPAMPLPRWLELMRRDKKAKGGRMRFVLLERLGAAVLSDIVSESDLASVLPQ